MSAGHSLYEFLLARNGAPGEMPALFDARMGRWYGYDELRHTTSGLSEELRTDGKSLAFVALENDIESIVAYLACLAAGHAVAIIDSGAPSGAMTELIDRYAPEFVYVPSAATAVTGVGVLDSYRELPTPPLPGGMYRRRQAAPADVHPALQLLLSTSGSTGSPKFVRLSARNVAANVRDIIAALAISDTERAVTSLPLSYSYGLSILQCHLRAGASVVVTKRGIAEPEFWSLVRDLECTSFAGVPFSYRVMRKLAQSVIDIPSLIKMTQAGGRLELGDAEYFHAFMEAKGGQFFVMYGQTEASPRMTTLSHRDFPRKQGSVGLPMASGRIWVSGGERSGPDAAGTDVAGEICFEGPNVMLGYATCRDDLSKGDEMNGVLATGDLGHVDRDGFLFIEGRAKRIGKVLGRRINLDEVESFLGDVGPCAVVEAREKLVIFLAVNGIGDAVRARLARRFGLRDHHMRVVEIAAVPLLSNGKIDYLALASLP